MFLEDTVVWDIVWLEDEVLYLAGLTQGPAPDSPVGFPRDSLPGGTRFFVARYDAFELTWWREYEGVGSWTSVMRVELAPGLDGGVWLAGDCGGDLIGPGVHLKPEANPDGWGTGRPAYLLGLDAAGDVASAQVISDQGLVKTWSKVRLVPGPEGDVYVLLAASGRASFGDVVYYARADAQGETDQFVARIGAGGAHRWSHHIGVGPSQAPGYGPRGWRSSDGGLVMNATILQSLPPGFKGEPPWTVELESGAWRIQFDLDGAAAELTAGVLWDPTGDDEGGVFGVGSTESFVPTGSGGVPGTPFYGRVRIGSNQEVAWAAPFKAGVLTMSSNMWTPSQVPLPGGGGVDVGWAYDSETSVEFAGLVLKQTPPPMEYLKGKPDDVVLRAWDEFGQEQAAERVGPDSWSGPLPDPGSGVGAASYAVVARAPRHVVWSYTMYGHYSGQYRKHTVLRSWSW